MSSRSSVFVSYSQADSRYAKRLMKALRDAGIRLWLDVNELRPGDSLMERIQLAIGRAEFFLILLSTNSVGSRWVQLELETALTHQLKGRERFIIPVLLNPCSVPPFLERLVHVDFSNRKKFAHNVERLMRAIDSSHLEDMNASATAMGPKKPTTLERMSADRELASDPWFEQFKELPLVQMCRDASILGSYSVKFVQELATALEMASNQSGGIAFNNLCALLGFLSDIPEELSYSIDIVNMLRILTENPFIETEYRWFILSHITRRSSLLPDRPKRHASLPNIFPLARIDPLASRVIVDFFKRAADAREKDQLCELWRLGSVDYRESIWSYLLRTCEFNSEPKLSTTVTLENDFNCVAKTCLSSWQQMSSRPQPGDAEHLERLINIRKKQSAPNVDEIIGSVERLCFDNSSVVNSTVRRLVSRDVIRRIGEFLGSSYQYHLLSGLIASPNIDVLTSTFALTIMAYDQQIDNLRLHDWLPGCLMRRKVVGRFTGMSVISGLIDEVANDDSPPIHALSILAKLVSMFPSTPFLASISLEIKEKKANPSLRMVDRLVHGKITPDKVITYAKKLQSTEGSDDIY